MSMVPFWLHFKIKNKYSIWKLIGIQDRFEECKFPLWIDF